MTDKVRQTGRQRGLQMWKRRIIKDVVSGGNWSSSSHTQSHLPVLSFRLIAGGNWFLTQKTRSAQQPADHWIQYLTNTTKQYEAVISWWNPESCLWGRRPELMLIQWLLICRVAWSTHFMLHLTPSQSKRANEWMWCRDVNPLSPEMIQWLVVCVKTQLLLLLFTHDERNEKAKHKVGLAFSQCGRQCGVCLCWRCNTRDWLEV